MVGSMMLLKMLHCRTKTAKSRRKRSKIRDDNEAVSSQVMKFKVAKIKKEEESVGVCRICLKDGKLSIFKDNDSEGLSEAINDFGGIEVSADDPYPKFLCRSCHALLQGAVLFRQTAQKTDNILKAQKLIKNPEPITEAEVPCGMSDDDADDLPIKPKETKVKSQTLLQCKRCDIEFNTFREYSEHLLSDEHENKRITCQICNNSYAPEYYKRHMSIHNAKTSHMCDICGKNFAVKSLFTRHRLTHFYDLPFQCALCPYRGRFTESLKMHMRSHTGERPYQCEQCPSRFINKSNLNKHVLTHRGEHDFHCEVCGRGYYTKRELELHIKVDHTGLREHVCRTCGKAFGYRKQMMKHELKVHKREKMKSGRMPIYLKVESMKQQNVDVTMET